MGEQTCSDCSMWFVAHLCTLISHRSMMGAHKTGLWSALHLRSLMGWLLRLLVVTPCAPLDGQTAVWACGLQTNPYQEACTDAGWPDCCLPPQPAANSF